MNSEMVSQEMREDLERITTKAGRFQAAQPFPEALAASLEHKLRIECTHGSTAIEGNTLTLRETQLLIDEGITPQGAKKLREIYESLNHDKAVRHVQALAKAGQPITEEAVRQMHRLVMAQIDDETAGCYRRERVMVTGAPVQPIRPERIPAEMQVLLEWAASSPLHPILRASELHYRFVKIHPFTNGNDAPCGCCSTGCSWPKDTRSPLSRRKNAPITFTPSTRLTGTARWIISSSF